MDQVGRYRVLGEVARGGMGLVLRGESPEARPVALKLLLGGPAASEGQRRRFRREVEALLKVRHPHVVSLLDAGVERGFPWLALEWIAGETLEARLAREGPLDQREAVELVEKLALALDHCHAQGVLHRDLKPSNVLLRGSDGEPLLSDFGLTADASLEDEGERSRLTRSGQFLGTPGYWAPEQARGELALIGPATDVWGLGGLLHALLTGEPPVRARSPADLFAVLERPPPPPSALRPGIPPALDAVCARCLTLDPAGRYPGPGAVAADLARVRAGQTPLAARRRRPLALGAGLGLVLAGASALALRPAPRAESPPALASSPATPAELEARAEAAWRLFQAGDVERAAEELEAILARDPRQLRALVGSSAVWVARGDLERALALAERATALHPRDPRAHVARGTVRAHRGDTSGAEADFGQAIALEPRLAVAWTNRATSRLARDDLQGALSDAERAVELEPEGVVALGCRGAVLMRAGRLNEARRDLDRALQLDPLDAEALLSRAAVLGELRDLPAALQDCERALVLLPRSSTAWLNRGAMRGRSGDLRGALQDYDRALELEPGEATALWNRSAVRQDLGDLTGAVADLDLLLALHPAHPNAPHARERAEALREQLAGRATGD